MVTTPDYRSLPVAVDGTCYIVERTGGRVQAYAQDALKGTSKPNLEKSLREIAREGLPTSELKELFDDLAAGYLPVRAKQPEVAGLGGQEMMH